MLKHKALFIAILAAQAVMGGAQAADGTAIVTLVQPGENYSPVAFLPAPSQAPRESAPIVTLAQLGENYSPVAFLPAPSAVAKVGAPLVSLAQVMESAVSSPRKTYTTDASQVEELHLLKDGSTVYVFKDGKMGMENRFGIPASMPEGVRMETKNGQAIVMKGDEVWRVHALLNQERLLVNSGT
jgi:hypothetical protein